MNQRIANRNMPPALADRFFWQLAGDERLARVYQHWVATGASGDSFWVAAESREYKSEWGIPFGEYRLWQGRLHDPRSLMQLASNPFMLNMLFGVWCGKRALPSNRGDLFAGFIRNLLSREGLLVKGPDTPTPEGERLLLGLADLAWRMQRERIGSAAAEESTDFGVLTVAPRAAVLEALGAETLLTKALDSTLLEGTDELRFRHQLLQEYFTAQALQSRLTETPAAELWPAERWWERTGWEETAVLLAGFYPEDCSAVIRWLADAQPDVAAQCLSESGAQVPAELRRELQAEWMPRLTVGPPESRAAIGRALCRADLDTRAGVGLRKDGVPEIDWVEILGGEFIYQEGERPMIAGFTIARYPITNAQYQAFLDSSDGYGEDRWWAGLTEPDRTPGISAWTESNHPRERVSWQEAMAFCAWLGHKLGRDVHLPTEWEWERAARGTDGRIYPWGNELDAGYANTAESKLWRTSAVGLYPEGASPEGLLDLSGNVWEWCLNEYEKPKRTQPGGKESRVLRGGSWYRIQENARAVYRDFSHPGNRGFNIGFRVVCSSPIR